MTKSLIRPTIDPSIRTLPENFNPGNYDVICGRGKIPMNHIGNKRFKVVIDNYYERYAKASTKFEKTLVVSEIVDTIRENSGAGGFVKFCEVGGGYWYEVGDQMAREKVSQALRNQLADQYKSSNVRKLYRRKKLRQGKIDAMLHRNIKTAVKLMEETNHSLKVQGLKYDDAAKNTQGAKSA